MEGKYDIWVIDQACSVKMAGYWPSPLKGLSHGILSYFEHPQNYRLIEGNLKITLYKGN